MKVFTHVFSNNVPSEVWDFGINIRDYNFISISFGDGYLHDAGRHVIPTQTLTKNRAFNILVHDTNEGDRATYDDELLVVKFITDTSLQIIANYGNSKNKVNSCSSTSCVLILFN